MNNPLKEFCNAWKATFKCDDTDCVVCPFLAFVQCVTKHNKGCMMGRAVRTFIESPIARKKAKRIIEEAIGVPLLIAQAILREHSE